MIVVLCTDVHAREASTSRVVCRSNALLLFTILSMLQGKGSAGIQQVPRRAAAFSCPSLSQLKTRSQPSCTGQAFNLLPLVNSESSLLEATWPCPVCETEKLETTRKARSLFRPASLMAACSRHSYW
jgi:hypothetical protein